MTGINAKHVLCFILESSCSAILMIGFKLSHAIVIMKAQLTGMDETNFLKVSLRSAMSNPNSFLSQKLGHWFNQGRTLSDILMRAAHRMPYFDFSKLNLP